MSNHLSTFSEDTFFNQYLCYTFTNESDRDVKVLVKSQDNRDTVFYLNAEDRATNVVLASGGGTVIVFDMANGGAEPEASWDRPISGSTDIRLCLQAGRLWVKGHVEE